MAFRLFAALTFVLLAVGVSAQTSRNCEAVLKPAESLANSDYHMMQAYMSLHAAHDYEERKKEEGNSRAASASNWPFSGEYRDSTNASEFTKKIANRLRAEGYNLNASESRSSYRRGVEAFQVKAWADCQQAGALMIRAKPEKEREGFTLFVEWAPPQGVESAPIKLTARGATINGRATYSGELKSSGVRTFQVQPDPSNQTISLTAQVSTFADELVFRRPFPKVRQAPELTPPPPPRDIVISVSSAGLGLSPKEDLFQFLPDAITHYQLANRFDRPVHRVEWIPTSQLMPVSGLPGYVGYVHARIDPENDYRVMLWGALLAGTPAIKGYVRVTFR